MLISKTSRLVLVGAVALALSASGCGDDEPQPKKPRPSRAKKSSKSGGGAKGKGKGKLEGYTKVEDVVADRDEARALRRKFVSRDFDPDHSGNENRDPFRSFVVMHPSANNGEDDGSIQPTEVCTAKNMVASNYALRDLRLIGIVLRGTRSFALFRDNSSFGHIVRRGDCVGREKARVEKIGTGFVRLEIVPEPSPNAAPRPPKTQEVQLYPEELDIDDSLLDLEEGVEAEGLSQEE